MSYQNRNLIVSILVCQFFWLSSPTIFCILNHDKSWKKHQAWFAILFSQDGFIVLIRWITYLFNPSEIKKIKATDIDGDSAEQIRYCGWSTARNALVSYSFIICGMFFCPFLRRLKYIGGSMFVQVWSNLLFFVLLFQMGWHSAINSFFLYSGFCLQM